MINSKVQQAIESIILALLTLVVYLFTINPITKPYSLYALIVCVILLLSLYVFSIKHQGETLWKIRSRMFKILAFTFATAILLWVGTTGWYLSKFFYLLYLLGISLAFLFSTSVAFSFILVLIAILLPNIGELNTNFDIATMLSLFLIVPLSYFLSHQYLKVKEKEKKILILENEKKNFESKVDELLQNKVTKVSADLREPINDIKQLAYYIPKISAKKEKDEYRQRIIKSSEKALAVVKHFEQETTGRTVLRNPEVTKPKTS